MRTVLAANIMTLDGFYTGPDGNLLMLNMDAAFDAYNLERMRSAGTVLLGRTSFEMFSSFWPMIAEAPDDATNPALSAVNREFSRLYRDVPKVVVSDHLIVPDDNPWRDTTEVVSRAGIHDRLATERAGGGNDIVIFGSRTLWTALLADGQLDELHLIVGPAAIGAGTPVFTEPASLTLVECRQLDRSSNALLRYSTSR